MRKLNEKEIEFMMEMTPNQMWDQCREMIRANVSTEQYDALFAYTEFSRYADGQLVLSVPSQFVYDMLEREDYAPLIVSVIHRVFGPQTSLGYKIPVVKRPKAEVLVSASQQPAVQNGQPSVTANVSPDALTAPAVADLDSQLHKGYFFENYLEGESNRLARSVGEAVAKNPAKTFNPLFVYGPSGCGKTHLVNAIGWRVKQLHPELRVLYLSAHLFTVQYTDAVRQNKTNDLIAFYQQIDVLIIDDVQELSGKLKTQNTFFHIFNHLQLNNKQIILTSDRPPIKIEGLEDRLLTRFKWGLQAEIEKPTKALRKAILLSKVKHDGLNIPEKVVEYIAQHVDESVRDLEGILTSLMAYSVVYDCEISMQLVNKMMPRFISNVQEEAPKTIDSIKAKVCQHFNVGVDVIDSRQRTQRISYIRQVAIYLANKHTDLSTVQIGRNVGGRNHATVMHSISQVKNLLDIDPEVRRDINEIEAIL